MAKLKEGNTDEGDGGRDDETESDNSWREGERELRQETERDDGEGERWRENVFNYSALPVFSIYGPFRAASRSYIYTYCRARAAPLSTAHQGSFSPQKTGETRRKT